MSNLRNFKASLSCVSLQQSTLDLLRWFCTVQLSSSKKKSSWLLLSTAAEGIKLMRGDTWWVIAPSTRPLVLLTGLVWSFIYTPFCSGFQDNFPGSLQSTNYKARPRSLGGLLNSEKDHGFGCLLQKQKTTSVQPLWSLCRPGKEVDPSVKALGERGGGGSCVDGAAAAKTDRQKDSQTINSRGGGQTILTASMVAYIHSSGCLHQRNRAST